MADGEVPLGIRVKADGVDDAISKLRQLHDELNNGTISTKEYRTESRDLNTMLGSNTKLWNQTQQAIYAANPTLLNLSRTMSGFGQITAAASTGMTAVNTALLLLAGGNNNINSVKSQIAQLQVQLDNLVAAGEGSTTQAQDLRNAISALHTELGNLNNQNLGNIASAFISFGVAIGNTVTASIVALPKIMAAWDMMTASITAENLGVVLEAIAGGFTTVGAAALTALTTIIAPIAIAAAALYGLEALFEALDPKFGAYMTSLQSAIQKSWNVDGLEAYLLAPFVGMYVDLVGIGSQIQQFFTGLYNGILTDFVNPLITAIDDLIQTPGIHQLLSSMGLGGSIGTIPQATMPSTPSTSDVLKGIGINAPSLSGVGAGQDQIPTSITGPLSTMNTTSLSQLQQQGGMLQNLIDINANSQAQQALAQQQLDAITQQTTAQQTVKSALQQGQTSLQQQLSDLQNKLTQTQQFKPSAYEQDQLANSPNITASDFSDIMDNMKAQQNIQAQIDQVQSAIQQNKSQQQTLDNATSGLSPVLNSIGLSSDTGIGSIIAGALGDYAGIGGAGTSAQDMANFAATGDYGIFTKNAMTEGMPAAPTQQDQINAWLAAVNGPGSGMSGYTAADAAKALGYTSSSTGSSNIGSGAFGGLPGQYGNPIAAAVGFDGMVSSPTYFLAGEAGPEQVSIGPMASGKGGGVTFYTVINNAGSLLATSNLNDAVQQGLKIALKRAGFS